MGHNRRRQAAAPESHRSKDCAQNKRIDHAAAPLVKMSDAEEDRRAQDRGRNGTARNALECREDKAAIQKFLA